ncbi:hypothetical protein AAKU67_001562 [Oxalobacteraceae bacterium GrIS 2.11]
MSINVRDTAQLALTFCGLLGQNVALESMTTFNCSTWANAKALLGRAFGFHLWHNITVGLGQFHF